MNAKRNEKNDNRRNVLFGVVKIFDFSKFCKRGSQTDKNMKRQKKIIDRNEKRDKKDLFGKTGFCRMASRTADIFVNKGENKKIFVYISESNKNNEVLSKLYQ